MKLYKTIVIDDEINNISILNHFISKYCLNLKVVGEALNISDAVFEINHKKPDIVFLDIRLNEGEVFEVLNQVNHSEIQIIFVSSFDEYAIKAFEFDAIDYILKPISIEKLILAVNKAIKKIEQQHYFDIRNFTNNYNLEGMVYENKDYVAIASMDKIDLVQSGEIIYIEAESKYTTFYLKDGKKLTSNKSLAHYENCLDKSFFFRIHHTYVINIRYVSKILKKDGSYCELTNGVMIPIAKRKQDDFSRFLKIKD